MSAANDRPGPRSHLGELAELYALGALDPNERVDVERHAAACATCSRALGAAARTVAALDATFVPQLDPPDRLGSRIAASAADAAAAPLVLERERPRATGALPRWLAAAAALVVGLGGGALFERSADARHAAHDSAVLATIATSHFNHVTLTPRTSGVPVSKALYAGDGAWLYLIVDGVTCDCRVIVERSSSGSRDFGSPEVRGTTATLFVRDADRPDAVELVDRAGQILSRATLVYPAR